MENKKQVGGFSSHSSSFTNDLFGDKDSSKSSASNGIFSSIFQPTTMAAANHCFSSELGGSVHKQSNESHAMNHTTIQGANKEGLNSFVSNNECKSIFGERSGPCPLSSSIYYGGQEDMYVKVSNDQTPEYYPKYKKDDASEDPSGKNSQDASRGNWWQGSLYY